MAQINSPQKQSFTVGGVNTTYRLINEVVHQGQTNIDPQTQKTKQNMKSTHIRPTLLSVVYQKIVSDKKTEEQVLYSINVGDNIYFCNYTSLDPLELQKFCESNTLRFKCEPNHAHAIRQTSSGKFESLIGFTTGDILFLPELSPIRDTSSPKLVQHNKGSSLQQASAVTSIQWVPNATQYFIVCFASGQLCVLDKVREDPAPTTTEHTVHHTTEPLMFRVEHGKNPKLNPVMTWNVCRGAINDAQFSHDCKYLALACQDGYLRLFEYESQRLVAAFQSYYGGFLCCCFSPDDRYVAAGGEADTVELFSLTQHKLVCRGGGHQSWVSCVQFDPTSSKIPECYRVVTAAMDGMLAFYNFCPTDPRKPHRSLSLSSTSVKESLKDTPTSVVITTKLKSETATLEPVRTLMVSGEPISSLQVRDDLLLVSDWQGRVKFWKREQTKIT